LTLLCFRNGFTEDGLLDSHLPGLSALLCQLPNTREHFTAERMGIESIGRDLEDANLFMTLNQDPRSDPGVRRLVHQLEFGTEMPRDFPFERNTENFTQLMSKYAAHINIYLYRKVKIFLRAFCEILGFDSSKKQKDWMQLDRTDESWLWRRVEFTETRGFPHWHIIMKIGGVLETGLLARMVQNGRVVRQEMKCGNIKPGMHEAAWEMIECGQLAGQYLSLFSESIATASFYEDEERRKPIQIERYRSEYVRNYKRGNITLETHPCMRRFDDPECEVNENIELARVAAVSCMHACILNVCGGKENGDGCRFDFPKKTIPSTVTAMFRVSAS
jgi:hypothetical protein